MSGKGLLAIALAVIASVFLALVIESRSGQHSARHDDDDGEPDALQRYAACDAAVKAAVDAAGDRVEEMFGAGARTRVKEIASRRCREDGWPEEVTSCLRDAEDASALSRCIGRLHPDAHEQLMAELEGIPRAEADPPDAGVAPSDPLAPDLVGPPACIEYARTIERFSTCDQVPDATRKAFKDSYEQMRGAWANLPAASVDSMNESCKQAEDALKQALVQMCP